MRLLGAFGGIGSPAVYAQIMGHKIVGNIEPRSFAHRFDDEGRNTFLENFPGAWIVKKITEVPESELRDIDIIFGHPKCGTYSQLINKKGLDRQTYMAQKSSDFIKFIDIVNQVKPKFAFFDNLPKSLEANPPSLYQDLLPDYDISIEYVGNYYYGNCQKNRNRLFIIAAHKDLEYMFMPGERPNDASLRTTIEDLEGRHGELFNHDTHSIEAKSNSGRRVYQDDVMTWEQVQYTFRVKQDNKALHYVAQDGSIKYHFGFRKAIYDNPSPTLIGTHPVVHPKTCLPLSIRERARIMGFPDDFNFYGTKYEDDGTWVHNKNTAMIQQTGRCIPTEFPGFLIQQFNAFLEGDATYSCSMKRLTKENKYVKLSGYEPKFNCGC